MRKIHILTREGYDNWIETLGAYTTQEGAEAALEMFVLERVGGGHWTSPERERLNYRIDETTLEGDL